MSGTGGRQALVQTKVAVSLCHEKLGDPEQLTFLSLDSAVLEVGWLACFLQRVVVVRFRDGEC